MNSITKKDIDYVDKVETESNSSYPISLDEIKRRVARKNGRATNKENSRNKSKFSFYAQSETDNVKEIINDFGERIIRVDGNIPVDLPINNGDRYLFISYDQTVLTHGLHKYPAKFFPELPRWLIRRYSMELDTILDPFSGSSTTSVEALLLHRHSVGIDIDPFSRFLSKVKITFLKEVELKCA